jgi:tetratricopeptide (TPR) repeat protein
VHDLIYERGTANRYSQQGRPAWLIVWNWAYTTRPADYPHVLAFLKTFRAEVAVVSNQLSIPFYDDITEPTPATQHRGRPPIDYWLEEGTCTPRDNVALVLIRWGHTPEEIQALAGRVEATCPGLPRATLGDKATIVYRLDSTIPSYTQATTFAQQGDWERAIAIYNEALSANPESVRAYADRGRAYAALGAYEQALADFDAALSRMPQWQALQEEREQVRERLSLAE